jgi:hypothetical protein
MLASGRVSTLLHPEYMVISVHIERTQGLQFVLCTRAVPPYHRSVHSDKQRLRTRSTGLSSYTKERQLQLPLTLNVALALSAGNT